MNELLKITEQIKKSDISGKEIKVLDMSGKIVKKITPIAVESCMNPGTFNIKPIQIEWQNDMIIFKNEREIIELSVEDIEKSVLKLQIDEFVPKSVETKSHCVNCTNCGRCSW